MINIPTIEQLNILPRLYEAEHIHQVDKIVHLHFTIDQCHWWAIEWDGQDTFFGFVLLYGCSQYAEFGYFHLSELQEIKVVGLYEVLNDPYWTPQAMKDIALVRETVHFQSILQNQSIP